VARAIVELVGAQKGVTEDADVCLLREVKTKFKTHGISKIGAREKAITAIQLFLTPKAKPKSEDRTFLNKEFLKAAQAGAQVEMAQMLTAHPSVLSARSTSKGYTAMHYAAMSGALPVLDWLAANGLAPDTLSTPADGSAPLTPAQVADEYKRDLAANRVRMLTEGFKFFKSISAADDDSRLRQAARAGNAAAVSMLLKRDPSLARRPAALAPTGALFAAASGGHISVLRELMRCGGVNLVGGVVQDGPSVLECAVATQQAECANLLHLHERACDAAACRRRKGERRGRKRGRKREAPRAQWRKWGQHRPRERRGRRRRKGERPRPPASGGADPRCEAVARSVGAGGGV
jgi:hypothetical protein